MEGIRARALVATPGPWDLIGATEIAKTGPYWACIAGVFNLRPTRNPEDSLAKAEPAAPGNQRFHEACRNAEFIAGARMDVPALLSYIDAMESRTKALLAAYGAKDEAKLQDALVELERTMRPTSA